MNLGSIVSTLNWDSSRRDWQIYRKSGGDKKELMGHFDFVVFSDSMTFRKGSPGHVLVDDEELGLIFPVADGVKVKPVFSLMAAFSSGAVESPFDAAAILSSDAFQWVSLENKKPNYSSSVDCQCFVAISTFDFAEKLLKEHPQQRNFKFVEQVNGLSF